MSEIKVSVRHFPSSLSQNIDKGVIASSVPRQILSDQTIILAQGPFGMGFVGINSLWRRFAQKSKPDGLQSAAKLDPANGNT
jgi:hypothetical protein